MRTSSASHRGFGKAGDQRRATILDVARMAGVARETVSNVIRGQGRVGETTIARVRQVIETLDCAPHSGVDEPALAPHAGGSNLILGTR